ncbi:MAG: response regulator transcription factor [Gemmatimonadota bacterium]
MRILYAEDDRKLLEAISRGLREAGHDVDEAANGPDALSLAQSTQYDVIVLDVLLPGRSGIAVCQQLRETGVRVPILMLTALDAVENRIAGLDAGADDYLSKPFDFGELNARLRALARRHGEVAPSRIIVGDLVVDPARHTVHRGQRDIALTAREFALLLYLARNAGRVVTRAELMTNVWDDQNSYSNIIDVYASRLRRKIDEGESSPMFATLRGVGFRLDATTTGRTRAPRRRSSQRTD